MLDTFNFADHVIGIIIHSNIDKETTEAIHEKLLEKLEQHKNVNLFVELKKDSELSAEAVIKNMQFNIKHLGDFNKIAVVSDINWFNAGMAIKDLVVDSSIKTYSRDERIEALNWISQ